MQKWKVDNISWRISYSSVWEDMLTLTRNKANIDLPRTGITTLMLFIDACLCIPLDLKLNSTSSWEFNKAENEFIYVGIEDGIFYIEIEECPTDTVYKLKFKRKEALALLKYLERFLDERTKRELGESSSKRAPASR